MYVSEVFSTAENKGDMRVKMTEEEYTPFESEKTKESIPYDYEILLPQIKDILIKFKSLKFDVKTYNAISLLYYSLPEFVQEDIVSEREELFSEIKDNPRDLSNENRSKKLCMQYFQIIKRGLERHGFLRDSTSLTKESL